MKKKLLIVAGIVLLVVVVLVAALPLLVNADRFRPMVESEMRAALGREVKIGKLRLSLLAGGVEADELAIGEDPAFGREPFVQAKSLEVGVEMMPLLLSRSLRVRSLTLEEPQLRLLKTAGGKWNFSSLGAGEQQKKKAPAAGAPDLAVGELRVKNGRVIVGTAGSKAKTSTYEDVNVVVRNLSFTSAMPFTVEAKTPGGGAMKVEGKAGPLDPKDASRSPLEAQVELQDVDLASTGFLEPGSGIAGKLDYTGKLESDGEQALSEGTATVEQLRMAKGGAPARQPVSLNYATQYDVQKKAGTLSKGDIRTGSSTAKLSGNYDTRGASPVVHMKLAANNMPVNDVQGLLPAFGVVLPAGSSLQGGTASANLSIDGPLDKLVITGPINVANTKLSGYDLGSKMKGIAALAGLRTGSDTVIETLSSQLRVAPEGIKADALNLVVPSIGTVSGAGTIAANNALNFKMNAKLNQQSLLGGVSTLASFGQSKGSVPFMIQGTTSNPIFVPDVAGTMGQTVAAPAQGLGGVLGGFFGKKKQN